MIWQTSRGAIDLSGRGILMGILNVTPDSFSDGGAYLDVKAAVARGLEMHAEGATIIDVGGESTRPGATPVAAEEEMRRVLPVIAGLHAAIPSCLISVDTSKAGVARAAVEAGAAIINDVTALQGDPQMCHVAAATGAGVVLMHMQGSPRTMQDHPHYTDVIAEVRAALGASLRIARAAGISEDCLALDPGIGFGKGLAHNLTLLRRLAELRIDDRPLIVGVSRKSFLARTQPTAAQPERLWSTVALTALLRAQGAQVLRVHDVRENAAALRTVEAVLGSP